MQRKPSLSSPSCYGQRKTQFSHPEKHDEGEPRKTLQVFQETGCEERCKLQIALEGAKRHSDTQKWLVRYKNRNAATLKILFFLLCSIMIATRVVTKRPKKEINEGKKRLEE